MSIKVIRSVFATALAAYATSKGYKFVRQNEAFTKPVDSTPFLAMTLVPADVRNPTVDGLRKRYWGDCYVAIYTKDGIGAGLAETIAEEISALFPLWPKAYLPVSVEGTPSIKRATQDESGWWITPVCITYRMEA